MTLQSSNLQTVKSIPDDADDNDTRPLMYVAGTNTENRVTCRLFHSYYHNSMNKILKFYTPKNKTIHMNRVRIALYNHVVTF